MPINGGSHAASSRAAGRGSDISFEPRRGGIDAGTQVSLRHHGWQRLPEEIRDQTLGGFQCGWASDNELIDLVRCLDQAAVAIA